MLSLPSRTPYHHHAHTHTRTHARTRPTSQQSEHTRRGPRAWTGDLYRVLKASCPSLQQLLGLEAGWSGAWSGKKAFETLRRAAGGRELAASPQLG